MKLPGDRILIVDDDDEIRELLRDRLHAEGYAVTEASTGSEGLERIRAEDPNLVLLDLQLPGLDGLSVLEQLQREGMETTVVVITAYGSIEHAVEAMRLGAYDFIPKSFESERIRAIIAKGVERDHLRRENAYFRDLVTSAVSPFIAESPVMQEVMKIARKVAASPTTVLLLGESGTGKEVLARAIHAWSDREDHPYVVVNCVALAENLLESELFGHEKGAFTGADRQRKGKFEVARGGTLLLDEIGATPPSLQLKLLRVLQEGTFERVGGNQSLHADVRIIAATNRDLEKAVAEGRFASDLYYRLNVVPIHLPPLRQRGEDIPPLARYFLQKHTRRTKREIAAIAPQALECLRRYDWPGNVRELENAVERAVVLSTGPEIYLKDLPELLLGIQSAGVEDLEEGYHALMARHKRRVIQQALEQCGGNQTKAARLLGLQRTYLVRLIRQLKLR